MNIFLWDFLHVLYSKKRIQKCGKMRQVLKENIERLRKFEKLSLSTRASIIAELKPTFRREKRTLSLLTEKLSASLVLQLV